MKKEKIAILGSTGSIGTQCLDVLKITKDKQIYALSCNNNINLLLQQVKVFKPKVVCVYDGNKSDEFSYLAKKNNIKVKILSGMSGLCEIASLNEVDLVVNSLVGIIGIKPTIEVLNNKKQLALANKETLVCEGKKIMSLAKKNNIEIRPIDSEHSAIWQCLMGEDYDRIDKLLITCSGGPFYGKTLNDLKNIKVEDCLKHPTWNMGKKITIDCSTLVNKGLEVIEAHYLFGIKAENIDVVIQRESLIHSMVLMKDGSVIAQMGVPSMRIPIAYALYKNRRPNINEKKIGFNTLKSISIDKPDLKTFKGLKLAYDALKKGSTYMKKYCEADEYAVNDFINGKIKYLDIVNRIERAIQ